MADWFETRFSEPAGTEPVDPAFAAHVRRLVLEAWQADERSSVLADTGSDDDVETIVLDTEEPTIDRRGWRRPWPAVAAAAAIAVLAAGGALVADDGGEVDTAGAPTVLDGGASPSGGAPPTTAAPRQMVLRGIFEDVEAGSYVVDPDGDPATPLEVVYEVPAEGWSTWPGAAKFGDDGHVALTIATMGNLVRDGCLDHRPAEPAVGPSVDDLAMALSALAPFQVTSSVRDVQAFGFSGKHLALAVPDIPVTDEPGKRRFAGCEEGQLHSWIPSTDPEAFYGYNEEPGRTDEYWILDVEGTRLVIVKNRSPRSPAQDVAELEAMFASIRIEP